MRIYSRLRGLWLSTLLGIVVLVVSTGNWQSSIMQTAFVVLGLVMIAMQFYFLWMLQDESVRFLRAMQFNIAMLILLVVALVCIFSPIVMLLAFIAAGITGIISRYQLFWALDERIEQCGYDYPVGRIRWCFYASLIGGAIMVVIGLFESEASQLLQIIPNLVELVLFLTYIMSVQRAESAQ